jgi:NAD(P)-dependent dehydrogenase (short-subunit alcohol dehydrogenase family)
LTRTVAIVTGASSGIGAATRQELAEHGASVAVIRRHKDRLDTLVTTIEAAGGTALAVGADITDRGQAKTACRPSSRRIGRVDTRTALRLLAMAGAIWTTGAPTSHPCLPNDPSSPMTTMPIRNQRSRGQVASGPWTFPRDCARCVTSTSPRRAR